MSNLQRNVTHKIRELLERNLEERIINYLHRTWSIWLRFGGEHIRYGVFYFLISFCHFPEEVDNSLCLPLKLHRTTTLRHPCYRRRDNSPFHGYFSDLHYSVIKHVCEAIAGNFVVYAETASHPRWKGEKGYSSRMLETKNRLPPAPKQCCKISSN